MPLEEIIKKYEDLKARASANKLHSSEMKEATITITNFGMFGGGGQWATPIINYPEVAILGVARIHKQPVVKNDESMVCEMLHLSWSFDHLVVDGDMAASISGHLSKLLQSPAART